MSTESLIGRMRDEYVSEDLIRDVAAALTDATASLDARWEHSDHLTAKYYQRMRAAEREMHARELHHFEEEQKRAAAEAKIAAALAWMNAGGGRLEGHPLRRILTEGKTDDPQQ